MDNAPRFDLTIMHAASPGAYLADQFSVDASAHSYNDWQALAAVSDACGMPAQAARLRSDAAALQRTAAATFFDNTTGFMHDVRVNGRPLPDIGELELCGVCVFVCCSWRVFDCALVRCLSVYVKVSSAHFCAGCESFAALWAGMALPAQAAAIAAVLAGPAFNTTLPFPSYGATQAKFDPVGYGVWGRLCIVCESVLSPPRVLDAAGTGAAPCGWTRRTLPSAA